MAITKEEYIELILGVMDTIATDIITPNSSGSEIETRYIASEGRDDEQWLGYLRNSDGAVDIWLLTIAGLQGLGEDDDRKGATGTFSKPVRVVIDYYADYRHGVDVVGEVGSETSTNTEREFLKKVLAVDLALEQKRGCLDSRIYIDKWDMILKLRRFETATTHWMSGVLEIGFTDIIL